MQYPLVRLTFYDECYCGGCCVWKVPECRTAPRHVRTDARPLVCTATTTLTLRPPPPSTYQTSLIAMPAKKRCQFQVNTDAQCNSAALRIVGQCALCRAQFCGDHRMPEHHACNSLEDCRQQAFDRNKTKLEAERTVASKMATA